MGAIGFFSLESFVGESPVLDEISMMLHGEKFLPSVLGSTWKYIGEICIVWGTAFC